MDVAGILVDIAQIVIDVLLVLHDVRIRRRRSRGGTLGPRAHNHETGKCHCNKASLNKIHPIHDDRPPFLHLKFRVEHSVHYKKPGGPGKVAPVWGYSRERLMVRKYYDSNKASQQIFQQTISSR